MGPVAQVREAAPYISIEVARCLTRPDQSGRAEGRGGVDRCAGVGGQVHLMDQHISRLDTNTDDSGEQPNHGVGPGLRLLSSGPAAPATAAAHLKEPRSSSGA